MNIKNLRIAIMRTEENNHSSIEFCESLGFKTYSFPLISTLKIKDEMFSYFENDILQNKVNYIIFTSPNGLKYTLENVSINKRDLFLNKLKTTNIVCIGSKTKKELTNIDINNVMIPKEYSSSGILNLFSNLNIKDKKIYIPRNEYGTKELYNGLVKKGAIVKDIKVYTMKRSEDEIGKKLIEFIISNSIDVLAFTSSMMVHYFFEFVNLFSDKKKIINILNKECIVGAIGNMTAQTLKNYGVNVTVVPEIFTFESLLIKIKEQVIDKI